MSGGAIAGLGNPNPFRIRARAAWRRFRATFLAWVLFLVLILGIPTVVLALSMGGGR